MPGKPKCSLCALLNNCIINKLPFFFYQVCYAQLLNAISEQSEL